MPHAAPVAVPESQLETGTVAQDKEVLGDPPPPNGVTDVDQQHEDHAHQGSNNDEHRHHQQPGDGPHHKAETSEAAAMAALGLPVAFTGEKGAKRKSVRLGGGALSRFRVRWSHAAIRGPVISHYSCHLYCACFQRRTSDPNDISSDWRLLASHNHPGWLSHWMACYEGIVRLFFDAESGSDVVEPRAGDRQVRASTGGGHVLWEEFYEAAYWRLYSEYWQ